MRNGVALMETHDLDLLKVRGGCKGTPGVLCTPIRHSLLIFTRSSSFCISQGDTSSLKAHSSHMGGFYFILLLYLTSFILLNDY
jgi:hypothetical protein